MADPRLKQITIKTGVLKRLAKEKTVYEREAEAQKKRVERIKEDGQDEHVIKKQEEVLQESLMMLPDCQRRLVKAYDDLNELLRNEEELKDTKEYGNALSVLNDSKPLMSPEAK